MFLLSSGLWISLTCFEVECQTKNENATLERNKLMAEREREWPKLIGQNRQTTKQTDIEILSHLKIQVLAKMFN